MLTIRLRPEVRETLTSACRRAGERETGGMLFGEHLGIDDFAVIEATIASTGTVASFVRSLRATLGPLERFFARTNGEYRRFNYLGEWHSHPSFALVPSGTDDATMFELVEDPATNARFAVSMIVKLEKERLRAAAFVYFPGGARESCKVIDP